MKRHYLFPAIAAAAVTTAALDDLPIYLDAGCPGTGISRTTAQGPSTMDIGSGNTIPITCTEAYCGSDAAKVKNREFHSR